MIEVILKTLILVVSLIVHKCLIQKGVGALIKIWTVKIFTSKNYLKDKSESDVIFIVQIHLNNYLRNG